MSYYCGLVYHINIIFKTIQGDCSLQSYTSLESFFEIFLFLLNTVIIMNYFVWSQHWVFVNAIVTGECTILILRKLRFQGLCEIVQFLLNTVIIVNYFVRRQHCVFVISIVKYECALLILRKLRFSVCHRCYCILIYNDSVIL